MHSTQRNYAITKKLEVQLVANLCTEWLGIYSHLYLLWIQSAKEILYILPNTPVHCKNKYFKLLTATTYENVILN